MGTTVTTGSVGFTALGSPGRGRLRTLPQIGIMGSSSREEVPAAGPISGPGANSFAPPCGTAPPWEPRDGLTC